MFLPDPRKPLTAQPALVLLAMLVFGEARGQAREGQIGVAYTVSNRVNAPRNGRGRRFGLGWTGVILRAGAFDCMRETDPNYPKLLEPLKHEPESVWAQCLDVAESVMLVKVRDSTGHATHYHDGSVTPWWAQPAVIESGRMVPTVQIGDLFFYWEP